MGDEEKVDEMEPEEGSGEGESKGGGEAGGGGLAASRIVKILIYVVSGILAVFLMIGISYLVSKYVQERSYQKEQDIVVAPPPPPLAHYDLPVFQTATADEEPHFAKITVSLGFEDLNTVEKSVGLSEEIKSHVNVILIAGKIKEVYFKEFVVN